jgi:hypothetical protein
MVEGRSEHLITEAIQETWPKQNSQDLLQAASRTIEEAGGWNIAAARFVYQQAIEIGDFAQAARSLKEIERQQNARKEPQQSETTELIDPKRAVRDCSLINRAVTNGWNIPAEIMEELPQLLANVARNGDARAKVAAARVLVAMAQQNQKAKPAPVKRIKHVHTLKPITENSVEEHKRILAQRIAGLSNNAGGSPSDPGTS